MRLLIKRSQGQGQFLELSHQPWVLEEIDDDALSDPTRAPEYTAISYSWGPGRAPHPFESGELISARAISVLAATTRVSETTAIWLDALCVPSNGEARAQTLRRLGTIYARAREVLVVLSPGASPLFERYAERADVDRAILQRLEDEPWVKRFWTYQELARSQRLTFAVESGSSVTIDATEFLNHVGRALYEEQKTSANVTEFPALDNLTDVLASWIHTGSEPFAYQVMAGLAHRVGELPADRFNAVFGAIAPDAILEAAPDLAHAAERFMSACETKGDLSFIYTSAARSQEPGRSWRPAAGDLPPILAWHTFGQGQAGIVELTRVRLHDLVRVEPSPISDAARRYIEDYLSHGSGPTNDRGLVDCVSQQLKTMGFSCPAPPVELAGGLLFPGANATWTSKGAALIATEVRWAHGAPALLVEPTPTGTYRCYGVGVFVGPIPENGRASFDLE